MSVERWSGRVTGRRTLGLLVAWLGFQVVLAGLGGALNEGGGQGPPDLILFARPAAIAACIDALGEAGRALYLRTFYVDTVYPVVYAALFASVFVHLGRRLGAEGGAARLALGFAVGMLADWSENLCFLALMRSWPEAPGGLLLAASAFSHLKWGSLVVTLALAVGALALRLSRGRTPGRPDPRPGA